MNRKTTLILVSVLILLGAYTWWFQASKKNEVVPTPTPEPNRTVWTATVDQIAAIQITERATGNLVALRLAAPGVWEVTAPENRPADPAQVSNLTYNAANLSAMASLPSATDLSAFGLVNPAYTLEVSLADGAQLKAVIGDKIPTGNGYYLLRAGETTPLAVAEYSLKPFIDLLANPPYFVPTPTPSPTLATPSP